MAVTITPYVRNELAELKASQEWDGRWKALVEENWIGNHLPYFAYRKSSGTLLHTAYHSYIFERLAKRAIAEHDFIFEFGGGYGCLCNLVHAMGFTGRYVIFDFPEINALQRYYLGANNRATYPLSGLRSRPEGIFLMSDLNDMSVVADESAKAKQSLFTATFSFSEVPLEFRARFKDTLPLFGALFFAYQHTIHGFENVRYFNGIAASMPSHAASVMEFPHRPGNSYMTLVAGQSSS